MIEIVIASQFVKDKMERQFAPGPRRPVREATPVAVVAEPRAPVRRATVRALRVLADRIDPATRCARA